MGLPGACAAAMASSASAHMDGAVRRWKGLPEAELLERSGDVRGDGFGRSRSACERNGRKTALRLSFSVHNVTSPLMEAAPLAPSFHVCGFFSITNFIPHHLLIIL